MAKFKLKRPIRDVKDENDITEIEMKDESKISAMDFYSMPVTADGNSDLGAVAPVIANLYGLTEFQVSQLHPLDYVVLNGEVGKLLGQ